MISVRGLSKRHGARKVLEDVTVDVAAGETIAIVGPSGGGKTTLLRCLNYLEPFDAGHVDIAGFHLVPRMRGVTARETLRRLRAKVGMVFQQYQLFPHLTALANITLAPRVVHGLAPGDAEARARTLLTRVGLADRASAYPHELSGGQQQRVAIARALAQEPAVMLFDEPTSALDPVMRQEVLDVIRALAESGMTMLVVTHEAQFANDIATRQWRVENGTLVESTGR